MNQKFQVINRKSREINPITPFTRIQQLQSFSEEGEICLQHSQLLQFICFTCKNRMLCSQCISQSAHACHQIKNLQRSRQILKCELQQWTIRLDSKSQILDVIHEQLSNNIASTYTSAERYKQKIAREMQELINHIHQKKIQLVALLDKNYHQYTQEIRISMEKIRAKRHKIQSFNQIARGKIKEATVAQLAQFYAQKNDSIMSLIGQQEINFYKQKIAEPNWAIDTELLLKIHNQVQKISLKVINFDRNLIGQFQQKQLQSNKFIKQKMKKTLKISDLAKVQKPTIKAKDINNSSSNLQLATMTPKNQSIQKIKAKKSPESSLLKKRKKSANKMISMPASPAKDNQIFQDLTSDPSRKKLFRKKQK